MEKNKDSIFIRDEYKQLELLQLGLGSHST